MLQRVRALYVFVVCMPTLMSDGRFLSSGGGGGQAVLASPMRVE